MITPRSSSLQTKIPLPGMKYFCELLIWEDPADHTPPQILQVPVNLLGCPPGQDNKLLLTISHTLEA